MKHFVRKWAGRIYGTNTGNLWVEINETADKLLKGEVRISDDRFGLLVYEVSGLYDANHSNKLTLKSDKVLTADENAKVGNLEVTAELTPKGNLRGE